MVAVISYADSEVVLRFPTYPEDECHPGHSESTEQNHEIHPYENRLCTLMCAFTAAFRVK